RHADRTAKMKTTDFQIGEDEDAGTAPLLGRLKVGRRRRSSPNLGEMVAAVLLVDPIVRSELVGDGSRRQPVGEDRAPYEVLRWCTVAVYMQCIQRSG
ncbi:hypothetical protein ACLOJK_036619, partial [Asimina triloba]